VLLIQAKDDTIVPFDIFAAGVPRTNPRIEVLATEHGGHLGFIGRKPHRLWADDAIMEWITGESATKAPSDSSRL
jgi:predicted alpha/beta-fold hydrolase